MVHSITSIDLSRLINMLENVLVTHNYERVSVIVTR